MKTDPSPPTFDANDDNDKW